MVGAEKPLCSMFVSFFRYTSQCRLMVLEGALFDQLAMCHLMAICVCMPSSWLCEASISAYVGVCCRGRAVVVESFPVVDHLVAIICF